MSFYVFYFCRSWGTWREVNLTYLEVKMITVSTINIWDQKTQCPFPLVCGAHEVRCSLSYFNFEVIYRAKLKMRGGATLQINENRWARKSWDDCVPSPIG